MSIIFNRSIEYFIYTKCNYTFLFVKPIFNLVKFLAGVRNYYKNLINPTLDL